MMIHQQQFPPKRPLLLHIARAPPFGFSRKYIGSQLTCEFCFALSTIHHISQVGFWLQKMCAEFFGSARGKGVKNATFLKYSRIFRFLG